MRSESYKIVFSDYYYYFNPEDPNDIQNQKFKILPCDHDKLQNGINKSTMYNLQMPSKDNQNDNDPISHRLEKSKSNYISAQPQFAQQGLYKKIEDNTTKIPAKNKEIVNSSSANNLLRQYRVSGASSYVNNSNNQVQMNNSGTSSGKGKVIGGSINSNNSTSTSNQNSNSIRKSSSKPYM